MFALCDGGVVAEPVTVTCGWDVFADELDDVVLQHVRKRTSPHVMLRTSPTAVVVSCSTTEDAGALLSFPVQAEGASPNLVASIVRSTQRQHFKTILHTHTPPLVYCSLSMPFVSSADTCDLSTYCLYWQLFRL